MIRNKATSDTPCLKVSTRTLPMYTQPQQQAYFSKHGNISAKNVTCTPPPPRCEGLPDVCMSHIPICFNVQSCKGYIGFHHGLARGSYSEPCLRSQRQPGLGPDWKDPFLQVCRDFASNPKLETLGFRSTKPCSMAPSNYIPRGMEVLPRGAQAAKDVRPLPASF